MSKHTPGPWYGRSAHNPVLLQGCEVANLSIAFACGGGDPGREEYIANARLIASAPDLLENLIGCMEALATYSPDCMEVECARKVIAKATGADHA